MFVVTRYHVVGECEAADQQWLIRCQVSSHPWTSDRNDKRIKRYRSRGNAQRTVDFSGLIYGQGGWTYAVEEW